MHIAGEDIDPIENPMSVISHEKWNLLAIYLIWHLIFIDKLTIHHSSKKLLIVTDGRDCSVPQLVRPRNYASDRCPVPRRHIYIWTSTLGRGVERKRIHPWILTSKLPYTIECDANRRPQLIKIQRMGTSIGHCPGWDPSIKPHPPMAQGSLWRKGQKDCKSQCWCMKVEKQWLTTDCKLSHVNL